MPDNSENNEERRKAIECLLAKLDEAEKAVKSPEDWISQEEVMRGLGLANPTHP